MARDKNDRQHAVNPLSLDDYMVGASATAIYPVKILGDQSQIVPLLYLALKLNGEAGEIAEEVGKALRDDAGMILQQRKEKLVKELGDVLWYLSQLCNELHLSFDEVARVNLEKLASRANRGVLKGSGSER